MHKNLGGGLPVFKGPMYQQGYGVGGYFRRFFKWIVPIAEKHVIPHIKSGLETIGKETINSVSSIAKDVIDGKNIKESADLHVNKAIDNLKENVEKKLRGEGKRKISKLNKKVIYRKTKNQDIFS